MHPLKNEDGAEDLQLRGGRQGVPLIHGRAGGGNVREHDRLARHVLVRADTSQRAASKRPREGNLVGTNNVANEAGHRDAAVLDLRMAEPGDLLLGLLADGQRVCKANAGEQAHTVSEEPLV